MRIRRISDFSFAEPSGQYKIDFQNREEHL